MAHELKSKTGVEIFSVGKWNGDEYTAEDLDEMVRAYSETNAKWKPALKLGHTNKQKLLQEDGLPAAGWIGKVYRKGEKLLADFIDIPEKIYQLIEKKAYKHVSSEVYWNIEVNGKTYRRMLAAVALLGADMPGVTNLKEILALYGLATFDEIKSYANNPEGLILKSYAIEEENEPMPKTEAEINLERDLAEQKTQAQKLETQVKDYSKQVSDKDKELAAKDAELKTYREKVAESERLAAVEAEKAANASLDREVDKLASDRLITKAAKPYVRELLAAEKKEYSVKAPKDGEKEEKFTKPELLRHILKLNSAVATVNFTESSVAKDEKEQKIEGQADADHEAIEKYAKEHKVSYSQAARAVIRERQAAS